MSISAVKTSKKRRDSGNFYNIKFFLERHTQIQDVWFFSFLQFFFLTFKRKLVSRSWGFYETQFILS